MFSSSVLNSTARCSSPVHYHHPHHQHLQQPTYSDIFSDHSSYISGCFFHHPNPLVQDADIGMSRFTTNAPSFENTPMYMMPQSAAVVASKKSDTRSKIRTAQGLRDRRVRLSINIARKFFDLQDLLGFDKPSGTLEWLLNNSNKAILELAAVSSSSTSSEATRTGDGYNSLSSSWTNQADQRMSCNASLETTKQKEALLARESRAKARARARARTVAKLCTPKLNHQKNRLLNNPEDKSSSANCHNFSSPSLMKSLVAESHEEEREQGKEQHKQNPQLQLHNYDSGIKSNYYWSGLNPNMPLDIIPPTSSSLAHQLNLSRDFDINGRGSWDYLLGNYTTL